MLRRLIGPIALLALCAGVLAGCGGGNRTAFTNGVTGTLPEVTREAPTVPAQTSASPEPAEPSTVTQTTVVQAPPAQTSTATDTGVSAAGAAAAGAAVAATTQTEASTDTTDWGWIAFAILAAVVLVGGLVWWLRGRHDRSAPGAPAPDDGAAAPPASP
jgi:cobalamin biosynthesis Mg chelatase CobN